MKELQLCFSDLMAEEPEAVTLPETVTMPEAGEKAYTIPDYVWENRCRYCVHKHAEENVPVPMWAVHKPMYQHLIPCQILSVANLHERPGECMSFAPRMDCYGICESCIHDNMFTDGFCLKKDHAEQRRVFWGQCYGGDEKLKDYYGRHRLSVCDDYKPDQYARRNDLSTK